MALPVASPPARAGTGRSSKRAAVVADRIVEDVMAQGWPVGEVLGAESELLARYGVSRAVYREAVRLVEHQQVARTRRGPGGGLVVTEPTVDAVIDAAVLYLHAVDARLDEVFAARIALEEIVIELASANVDEVGMGVLREAVAREASGAVTDPRAFHALLAELTGNAALVLFVEVLNQVAMLYSRDWRALGSKFGSDMHHAHAKLADAVLAGDAGLARHRMRKHLEAEGDYLRRRRSTRQLLPDDVVLADADGAKRAETVARAIAQQIVADGLQPGDLLGTETELMERHDVSRAVLREAARILEHHNVAAMRRGPGGGFFVSTPTPAAVADIAAIYLARRDVRLADLAGLRTAVELVLVDQAAAAIDDAGRARLEDALVRERTVSEEERAEAVHDLHAAIASLSGNRVLELVALVLIRLSRIHQIDKLAVRRRKQIGAEVQRTHEGIARAVQQGDRDLARLRMKRHLDALAAFTS